MGCEGEREGGLKEEEDIGDVLIDTNDPSVGTTRLYSPFAAPTKWTLTELI